MSPQTWATTDDPGTSVTTLTRSNAIGLVLALALSLLAFSPASADTDPDSDVDLDSPAGRDAVVVAVVDSGFNPYHLDFRADLMPQALAGEPLPLDDDPAGWLPGFPDADDFASYGAIDLTLDQDDLSVSQLRSIDDPAAQLPTSTDGEVHMRYLPGTKVVGAVRFGGSVFSGNGAHGHGTSSVSVGNLYGSCPECLVVLVTYGGGDREAASNWAMSQPWIDVVTNSFGFSTVMRDRIYDGADTDLQREASDRGQTIFFSAGNGQGNTFTAPNTTVQSSQEGPDWIITVGATRPDGAIFQGAGKPVDVNSIGTGYASGYSSGSDRVDATGNFSGTSNATPVTAGIYARALWQIRQAMTGPSRVQEDGIIAVGDVACGPVVVDCAVADGRLTATDLRFALLHGAERTPEGIAPTGLANTPAYPATDEMKLAAEGHGTFFGRVARFQEGLDNLDAEVSRVAGPLLGTVEPLERSQDERDWMTSLSWCRQQVHGTWSGGYFVDGETDLAGPDPAWPLRTSLEQTCPTVFGALKDAG